MKKINLAISGCYGQNGSTTNQISKNNKNLNLVSLTENKLINKKLWN